eukprot:TRINITY_DN37470_c0_g1_i1.p1 TRINITY_DN37470_c0_g1~~TRINITY_DN37470_c0_g1_i1.p1  ORF type:complete len:424 (+),score=167.93 TRINITY_DN37470_c0_g1_i1:90-1361(+)
MPTPHLSMQQRVDGEDWAAVLVDSYQRAVRNITRQQKAGLAFLVVFLLLVCLQIRSSSTHGEGNSAIANYHKKQLDRAARRLARSRNPNDGSDSERSRLAALSNAFAIYLIGDAQGKEMAAVLQQGSLVRAEELATKPSRDQAEYQVTWGRADELRGSFIHASGGGTAFSTLQFGRNRHELYSCDDKTGIIFEVSLATFELYPRWILPAGDGNTERPFKCEWMAVKDSRLYVGSVGKMWVESADTLHDDFMWVKVIGEHEPRPRSVLWEPVYSKIRDVLGCPGGYVMHEAVQFSAVHKEWFFLPFRVSKEPYSEDTEADQVGRSLVRCDTTRKRCQSFPVRGGSPDSKGGFVEFKFIPDGTDTVIVAVRMHKLPPQKDSPPKAPAAYLSWLVVMTATGEVLREDIPIPGGHKFEGLEIAARGV